MTPNAGNDVTEGQSSRQKHIDVHGVEQQKSRLPTGRLSHSNTGIPRDRHHDSHGVVSLIVHFRTKRINVGCASLFRCEFQLD